MLVFLFLFVPSVKPDDRVTVTVEKKEKEALGWRFWMLEGSWLLANMLFGATVLYYVAHP